MKPSVVLPLAMEKEKAAICVDFFFLTWYVPTGFIVGWAGQCLVLKF
jgi:hypothetical protein